MERSIVSQKDAIRISQIIGDALRKSGLTSKSVCEQTGIKESSLSKFKKGRSMETKSVRKLLDFFSIPETILEADGIDIHTIRMIYGEKKLAVISGIITEENGSWTYQTLTGEIVFVKGSPRDIITKKILQDMSARLDIFLDKNLI